MSTSVLPPLSGLAWNIDRTEMWSNNQQEAVSGADTFIAYWSYPKHQFKLTWNFLRQGLIDTTSYTEMSQLIGFFNLRQGNYDSFLYTADDDNSVTGQGIGIGDGTQITFQLAKLFGGAVEPVLAPNMVSTIYVAGTPLAAIAAPTNGALSATAAGSLAATTYYVRCTWVTAAGETIASTETSAGYTSDRVLNVAAPSSPPAGATGWNAYVSNTAGGGSNAETKQNASPNALGVTWVQPVTGLVVGAAYPAADKNSAWSVQFWGATFPGLVTLAVAPSSSQLVTADFTYYYPCRFDDGSMTVTKFMANRYNQGGLSFTSIKLGVGAS